MTRLLTLAAGGATLALSAIAVAPAHAASPTARLDIRSTTCSAGSLLTAELAREGRSLEIDVELYSNPRERWAVTVQQRDGRTLTVRETANREGEFDFWRYLPDRPGTDRVTVTARSLSTGERCAITVSG